MFSNPEQFASVTKTLFEFQLETFNMLTSKAIQGVEQVLALNVDTAKTAVADSISKARSFSEIKDPATLMSDAKAQMPSAEDATEYHRQLAAIVSGIQQEFANAAEAHMAEARTNLTALIYDVTKNVRPGSENAVAIVKTAIDNAFNGYEQVTKATRQAVATVEAQVAKATEQIAPVMSKPKAAAKPAAPAAKAAAKPAARPAPKPAAKPATKTAAKPRAKK